MAIRSIFVLFCVSVLLAASAIAGNGGPGKGGGGGGGGGGGSSDADLSVTKSDSPDPVAAGSELTYTISAKNKGPAKATGVQVTDSLPAAVTWKSTSTTKGNCTGTTVVSCSIGALAKNESATITIKVVPDSSGTISNTAEIKGDQPDSLQGNNSSTAETTVESPPPPPPPPSDADMSLTVSESQDPIRAGDRLVYVATWQNKSTETIDSVALRFFVGNGPQVVVESVEASRGFCTTHQWTGSNAGAGCSLGSVEPGAWGSVTLAVRPMPALNRMPFVLTTDVKMIKDFCDRGDPREDPASYLVELLSACTPAFDLLAEVSLATTIQPI